ncbi:MAG: 3-phosphoserine/phosphohydroxythreonine transaminase [Chloroflexaceae bacterium]|nr:3-phosphoserine/phosphohydroxythreonine transaminase [Chloroflexaceae bacterium]
MGRVYNFNPGPAALPLAVLEQAQQELLDYQGSGMSVMELSHRSKEYEAINNQANERVRRLLGLPADYKVLFLQGGASLQFAMVPLNFLHSGKTANYIMTGSWSEKALKEASVVGPTHEAASTASENYCRIPGNDELTLSDNPAYVHINSNNTIYGTQWHHVPAVGDVPLISDASSDILSRPLDVEKFALIYAGAQKNAGPSGVTLVMVRERLLADESKSVPAFLRYTTHAKADSLYNTPPTFAVYLLNLVLGWIEGQGGLAAIDEQNRAKANLIYSIIDEHSEFFRSPVQVESRSLMNIVFRLPTEELEQQFVKQATAARMVGLKGHRSVGGMRASIYNAVSLEACEALAGFMRQFLQANG